ILTAGIAHEINNPLNYISGGLNGLENFFTEKELKNKKTTLFLTSIKTGLERVSSIVSGLNKLSRNKNTYNEDCDIHEIIETNLLIINNKIKHKINVNKRYSATQHIVLGNVGQLHQAFLNILINAGQSIKTEGTVLIFTKNKNKNIFIEISDTGCGIEEKNLQKITDPFFTTKEPGKGTGLGLSISYNIIKEHNGKILFKSELKKGTTVRIELPLKPNEK
ncbi:MAG: sensor histidine kinase, partial [Bacteroidetes bacterium]|nr:sensor histidine kinase [Bacteroidota bacterium]